ncbi:MAG: FxsA family protein [Planctomycetaceae bacterium]|nr:FxsA family protein [Planctomycetaceae bacterium]
MFFRFLVILLISVSFLDLASLWFLKDLFAGWFVTLAVPGIAVGGGLLAWRQWRGLWRRYETKIAPNAMPQDMILNLVLVIIAAVFFVTPGFVSDLIALLFLFPLTRGLIVFVILQQHILLQTAKMHKQFQENAKKSGYYGNRGSSSQSQQHQDNEEVIDVEFKKE